MKITAKVEYACRAILELATHWPSTKPLQIQVISTRQNIPEKFLIQILLHLKQFGIIKSVRGKSGGYLLNKHPKEVTLSDVITFFDGSHLQINERKEELNDGHVMNLYWDDIKKVITEKLQTINFEAIANKKRKIDETVTFEI